jgi:ADP-dependent NAD(P)H-hydrate dehydratase / NAD(P)H-hydrate epimerase
MKYLSVAQMQAIEREANASGLSYAQMMENAGSGLAEVILDEYGYLEDDGVLGLVGAGNNGGDTLVALDHLAKEGWRTTAAIVRARPADDPLVALLANSGGRVIDLSQEANPGALTALLGEHALLLDGVLGTGTRLPLKPELAALLDNVRSGLLGMDNPPAVVAVDCPSGIDCDSGAAAPECLTAERTVTMAAVKHGLLKFPAFERVGGLQVIGIGLPEEGEGLAAWRAVQSFIPDEEWVRQVLPARPLDAHKGTFGTALVVAGSANFTGAAWLAGQAAYRSGAGLVTLAVPAPLHTALAGQFPEATWLLLPHKNGAIAADACQTVLENLGRVTAMLVGPGFGLAQTTADFLEGLLVGSTEHQQAERHSAQYHSKPLPSELPPLVIDADGLKLLANNGNWPKLLPDSAVLTPHPGEMWVLTGLSRDEIQANRLEVALRYSREWGHVVVLKGAFTLIAAPDGRLAVIPVATPALARAGSGDVLAGLIIGLRAQGVEPFQAAVAGAWVHAQAGLRAAEELGNTASVLAGDVLRAVITILGEL